MSGAAAGAGPEHAPGPRCRCGHLQVAHRHYRRGTDCALCDCDRFRRPRTGWLRRLLG